MEEELVKTLPFDKGKERDTRRGGLTMNRSVLCLLLFVLGLSVPASAEIEVVQDRFGGPTMVKTKLGAIQGRPSIVLIGIYEANDQPSVAMEIVSRADSWRYLQCNQTSWLVDDEPFQLPQPKHDGQVGAGYVLEFLIIAPIPMKQIEQLAQAKKVEFKVCNDEYTASTTEVADFRDFISKLREAAPQKTP